MDIKVQAPQDQIPAGRREDAHRGDHWARKCLRAAYLWTSAAWCRTSGTLVAMVPRPSSEGKPLVDRGLHDFTGGACAQPKNLLAPIGTLVSRHRVESGDVADRRAKDLGRVVFGGPMMGVATRGELFAIPIQKEQLRACFSCRWLGGGFITTLRGNCIRCGRCHAAPVPAGYRRPSSTTPSSRGIWDEAEAIGVLDCVECGTCSYRLSRAHPARAALPSREAGPQCARRSRRRQKMPAKPLLLSSSPHLYSHR